jgi:hypothetical protein
MFCFHVPVHLQGKCLYVDTYFMAMYSFVPPFREANFCGVPSCVFDKLGCAAGEKHLRNTAVNQYEDLGTSTQKAYKIP